jgi:hypothetical protein
MRLNALRAAAASSTGPVREPAADQGSARTAKERLLHTLTRERHQCRPAEADAPLLRHLLNQEPDEGFAV